MGWPSSLLICFLQVILLSFSFFIVVNSYAQYECPDKKLQEVAKKLIDHENSSREEYKKYFPANGTPKKRSGS